MNVTVFGHPDEAHIDPVRVVAGDGVDGVDAEDVTVVPDGLARADGANRDRGENQQASKNAKVDCHLQQDYLDAGVNSSISFRWNSIPAVFVVYVGGVLKLANPGRLR